MTLLLDSDAAIGDNINTAEAADKSLTKTDPLSGDGHPIKEVEYGLSTDSGGGGTKEGLVKEMNTLGRCCAMTLFMIVTCVLHAMNRMMQSPCEKFLGEASIGNRNPMQSLIFDFMN